LGSGGETLATDDVGGIQYQRVKLVNGTLDATDAIGGEATNGLDVDVTRVIPGTSATHLGKAIDTATGGTDTGVLVLGTRDDALTTLTPIDGDNVQFRVTSTGEVWVKDDDNNGLLTTIDADTSSMNTDLTTLAGAVSGTEMQVDLVSAAVTNAGTFVVQEDGAALTALQLIDDVVATDDTTTHATGTTKGVNIMAAATPTDGSVAANDIGSVAMSTDRRLHVDSQIVGTDAALDVSAATVTVDLGANNDVSINAGSNTIGEVTIGAATGAAGDLAKAIDTASGGTDTGVAALVIRDDSLTTLTPVDGDYVPLRVNSTGSLHVTGGGGGTEYNEDDATPNPIIGTATLMERDDALGGLTPIEGDFAALRCDANGALWTHDDALDAAISGSEMQVDVVAALPAGTNLVGDVGLSGARTSGGTSFFKSIDLDESEEEVKSTAGQVYWIHAMNLKASTLFLKFYNDTAANVVVGTDVPDLTFPLATQGDTNGAGFTLSIPNGIAFSTAITVACTTGVADADSGAPGANECIVNIGFA